jgi:hypothetical protein
VKKNTLVTSEVGQVQAIIDVVGIAVMNAVKAQSEEFTTAELQRILAQGDELASDLKARAIAKMNELAVHVVGHLKLISGGTEIIIDETDGQSTIAQAKDTFPGYIDPDFVNYRTDVKVQPTKKIKVQVFEMIKDGNLTQIFGGFGENRDRLCLSQSQIIRFVKDHSKWLRKDGYGTLFLFKENGEYFVAGVRLHESRLEVYVHRLSLGCVWRAVDRRRIVVPQL